jgi:hypothetical protein
MNGIESTKSKSASPARYKNLAVSSRNAKRSAFFPTPKNQTPSLSPGLRPGFFSLAIRAAIAAENHIPVVPG